MDDALNDVLERHTKGIVMYIEIVAFVSISSTMFSYLQVCGEEGCQQEDINDHKGTTG